MKTIFSILDKRPPILIWWLSVLLITVLICLRIVAQNHVDLAPLLVLPVLLSSWYGNKKSGTAIAIFTAISLLISSWAIDSFHFNDNATIYDSLVALLTYLLIGIIVMDFRDVHRAEKTAADTDSLTGAYNSRRFYSELTSEIDRSRRYKHMFSLAYIDVDNFKLINDTLGHASGDDLLIELYKCLLIELRSTDIVARIGGDEFICLLPETGQIDAKSAMLKAEKSLIDNMRKNDWDVSFSVGVVTFVQLPDDAYEAVNLADELMYKVKNNTKNAIAYSVWPDPISTS